MLLPFALVLLSLELDEFAENGGDLKFLVLRAFKSRGYTTFTTFMDLQQLLHLCHLIDLHCFIFLIFLFTGYLDLLILLGDQIAYLGL